MVIVQGTFMMDPQDRDTFLRQSIEQMEISRAEKGCLEYVLAPDPLQPGRVILSERWESMDDLGAHVAALTTRREQAAAAGQTPAVEPERSDFAVYEVTATKPLG